MRLGPRIRIMKILTAKQMAKLDRLSIKKHKISARQLMGTAARRCCEALAQRVGSQSKKSIVIVCGPGNNGGDGFAMATWLRNKQYRVDCYFLGKEKKLSAEAKYFLEKMHPKPTKITAKDHLPKLKKSLRSAGVIVDALFGTGLNRPLGGRLARILQAMNRAPGLKLAVDIPSGISGDTGRILGKAFRANLTVTFEVPKWGQVQAPGWDYVGELIISPIGLSKQGLRSMPARAEWVTRADIQKFFSSRRLDIHKGSSGKVLVIGGSAKMPGAGYLCATASLRAGAGLVTWAMPNEAFQKIDLRFPEVILQSWPSFGGKFAPGQPSDLERELRPFNALAVGPGLGQGGELVAFMELILKKNRKPVVIDADGLNLISKNRALLKHLGGTILTPHPKEMSRLCGKSLQEIQADRVGVATGFAKKYRLWLVLKGYRSVIAGPRGEVYLNSSGGPNLAVAGSGDVLTGMIAALLAQGLNARKASLAGVYLHGVAGDRLAQKLGDRGTLALEITEEIPLVLKELFSSS